MTLAIEPMRTMERPSGSTLLPGRVSPKPSTTDSSPRTTASTRPGAPELSHITAPAMDAASLRTMSAARAGFADAPAASIAKITAGRYLVDLGFMGTRRWGEVCRRIAWVRRRSFSPPRELSIEHLQRVDMNGHKHCACRRAIAAPSRRFFLAGLAAAAISPALAHAGGPASG